MKIAVVIPKYGLIGGAESMAFEVSERLAHMEGMEIHVLANKWVKGNAPVTFHKIPVISFPKFFHPISFAYLVHRWLAVHPQLLVHSHERVFAMDCFTCHGIPHQIWMKNVRQKRMKPFDRATAWVEGKGLNGNRKPLIMAVSSLVKDELLKQYDIPESHIRVIHPGVTLKRYSNPDQHQCRKEIRAVFNVSESEILILFVGMNFEIKRLGLVIQGMAEAVNRIGVGRNMKLMVIGKGDRRRYLKMAASMGVADRLIFTGPVTDVEKYYLAADVFAMPSVFDTFGISVLEAMAAGLPVIITNSVGAKDLVEDGKIGFVLSSSPSVSDMGDALARLTDPTLRLTLGENGKKIAYTRDWDRTAERVVSVYRRIEKQKIKRTCMQDGD